LPLSLVVVFMGIKDTANIKFSFVIDRMLGGLAKWLRIAGFNTLYNNQYIKENLIEISKQTHRLIVTRNRWFESQKSIKAIVLHDNYTIGQLRELFERLNTVPDPSNFFTRCIVCNSELVAAENKDVKGIVPLYVLETQRTFSKCPLCGRIYWSGTHKKKMLQTLKIILSDRQ